jgi:hypothetical protein
VWPFVLSGILACLLIAGTVTFFVVRRDDAAATAPVNAGLALADGVTAGGTTTGNAEALTDALTTRGLECSVRFTSADGGHAGCFGMSGRTTLAVAYQYKQDGAVSALTIKATGKSETAPALQLLAATVGPVAFPADLEKLTAVLRQTWGGALEGTWGKYEVVARGPKTVIDAERFGNQQMKVPVLHLDTTEPELARDLTGDGYTCTADNETCQRKPGLALKFSGPDTGITYLVATGATSAQLSEDLLGRVHGSAVAPIQDWVSRHLDGRTHIAYVAGWRVDLEAIGEQIRLTLFNEEFFLQMT